MLPTNRKSIKYLWLECPDGTDESANVRTLKREYVKMHMTDISRLMWFSRHLPFERP